MIKIIVDSTCDLSTDFINKHKIDVVPLQVIINNKPYKDKFELDIHTLYEHIKAGDDIKTSLPSYDDIFPLFEKYAKSNTPFIFFSFSKVLSGTFNFANLLIKDLKENYHTPMAVVDLQNGGLASAMIMERVIAYKDEQKSFDDIVHYANHITDQMKHLVLLEDLTQLRKGGRISAIKSLISNVLSIKPLLELNQGAIKPYKNAVGLKRAFNELINFIKKFAPNKDTQIGVLYSANENLLETLKSKLKDNGYNHITLGRIASVMTAHIGLDAVSVCFFTN